MKKSLADSIETLFTGARGVVMEDSTNDDLEVRAQWYTEEIDGSYSLSPQIWNLPVKKCYFLDGNDIQGEMVLAPSKAESLYITTDTESETERDKVIFLKDLDIKIEDKDSDEQLERFIKLNKNSKRKNCWSASQEDRSSPVVSLGGVRKSTPLA